MATLIKIQDFPDQLADGVHNLSSHTFKVALSNSAPLVTNTVFANITEISAGNGYTAGGATLGSLTTAESSGVMTWDAADVTWTASGGSIGPFRYAVIYNDTATSPADALVIGYDLGSAFTIAAGDSLTLRFDATGIFTIQWT